MTASGATIFVCVSCRRPVAGSVEAFDQPGRQLVTALTKHLADSGVGGIAVEAVECLAVCKRPCTVAVVAPGKWTYLIGDLDAGVDVAQIADAALSYCQSGDGIVPWKERPPAFRRGVVARVPPLGFKQLEPESL
jgi:predicted metal-binding protein